MDILKQIWEFIIKIFKFLWGKDIEYTPDEFYSDTRILKPEQIWLFLRRVLVLVLCYMVVSKIYASLNMSWNNYKACKGKDICVIKGPDMNYKRAYPYVKQINDKYALVICGTREDNEAELYNIRRNKFINLDKMPYSYGNGVVIFVNDKENVLIKEGKSSNKKLAFNVKRKSFEEDFNENNFKMKYRMDKACWRYTVNENKYISTKNCLKIGVFEVNTVDNNEKFVLGTFDFHDLVYTYKLSNGDVVFVKQNTTYIFKNDENRLVVPAENIIKRNQEIAARLNEKSRYYFGKDANELKNIQITNYKILFFNNSSYKNFSDTDKKSLIYDIRENKIYEGPNFIYSTVGETAEQISNNKWLFVGGGETLTHQEKNYTQIIKVNNKRGDIH